MSKNTKGGLGCLVIVALVLICGAIFIMIPDSPENESTTSELGGTASIVTSSPAVTATSSPTFTPVPTSTPIPTPNVAELPLQISSNNGWTLTVDSIEQLSSIDSETKRYRPENGVFVVLIGTLGNLTDENACLTGDDIVLVDSDGNQYEMNADLLDELKLRYNRDYPGFFLGQCLDYDTTAETFLVFDVPGRASLSLKVEDTSAYIGQVEAYEQEVALGTPTPPQTPTQVVDLSSQLATPSLQPIDRSPGVTQAVLNTNANFRSGPGTEHEVISTGRAGETYPVYARTSHGWLLLDTVGKTWVASSLTTLDREQDLIPIWDGNPIESSQVAVTPTVIIGLEVSRNDFFEVFTPPTGTFEFEPSSELRNGVPRVFGATPDTTMLMELIGPPDDLYQASLIANIPTEGAAVVETSVMAAAFVSVAIPTWDGANEWFADNLEEAMETGEASTVHEGKVLEITIIRELGIMALSIRVEGYGE